MSSDEFARIHNIILDPNTDVELAVRIITDAYDAEDVFLVKPVDIDKLAKTEPWIKMFKYSGFLFGEQYSLAAGSLQDAYSYFVEKGKWPHQSSRAHKVFTTLLTVLRAVGVTVNLPVSGNSLSRVTAHNPAEDESDNLSMQVDSGFRLQ